MARKNNAETTEQVRSRLIEISADVERRISENADKISQNRRRADELRAQIKEQKDYSHIKWLVPTVIVLLIASVLYASSKPGWGIFCLVIGLIFTFRWLSELVHCVRKSIRASAMLKDCLSGIEKMTDDNSSLRLEAAELRQQLENLNNSSR